MSSPDPQDPEQLLPAESASFASLIPTRFVASDEFMPLPQTPRQKAVEWGADAVWTGAPQWQIEALRRLEIPEEMQRNSGSGVVPVAEVSAG